MKVLAPAKVWVPVLTRPTLVASAVCRYRLEPTMTAPLALLVWVSMVPMVLTPEPPVPVAIQEVPFQMSEAAAPGAMDTPYMVKAAEATLLT